jgi:hypothetical protein
MSVGKIADRSRTRGFSATRRRRTPLGELLPAAKRRPPALLAQVASRNRNTLRRHVALDEFRRATHLEPAKRSHGLEHDERAARVTLEVAELYVACSITTSNASSAQRNQTGETSALPSWRYVVRTAGDGASSRVRTRSTQSATWRF